MTDDLSPRKEEASSCQDHLDADSNNFKVVLVDLCASFASANGVNPKFYFAAGQALVEDEFVSIRPGQKSIVRVEEDEIFNHLVGMGHPRGAYVARLVANRICRNVDQINDLGGTEFLQRLVLSDRSRVEELLSPLFGVGPGFVGVYCFLAGVKEK